MQQPWRILADDLTGALDTVSAWGGSAEVPVFLDTPAASAQPVQAVATCTRDVAPEELPARLASSLDWLGASGHAFKKIDSLLRGNTFREVAWLLRSGRFAGAVLAPAYPAQGRFTAQGRHWVASPHHPYGPRSHEHPEPLARALAHVGLGTQVISHPSDSLQHPGHVVIPDLLSDADLDQLAALAATPRGRGWLWCGNAGLARALTRHQASAPLPFAADCGSGRPLLLTASRHPVLREQLYHLAAHDLPIDLIDLAHAAALAPQQAQLRLAARMADLVAHHPRPPMLVVVGGDTLLTLCRAAGVRSLQIAGSSPRAGWGRSRMVGGLWDGLCCFSRSGAFGTPDDLSALLGLLAVPTSRPPELLK